jgi:hypothetical protein
MVLGRLLLDRILRQFYHPPFWNWCIIQWCFLGPLGQLEEMHILPDSVFVLPTDGMAINTIAGTSSGRIFLGGRDGCLYEVAYQVWRLAHELPCCCVTSEALLSQNLCFIIHKQSVILSSSWPSVLYLISMVLCHPPSSHIYCWIPSPYGLNHLSLIMWHWG